MPYRFSVVTPRRTFETEAATAARMIDIMQSARDEPGYSIVRIIDLATGHAVNQSQIMDALEAEQRA